MNIFGTIILFSLLAEYILNLVANLLNVKTLRDQLPKEFEGVYDSEAYEKSQAYTKVRTSFGVLASTITLLVTLASWFTGGFNYLDRAVRGLQLPEIWTGVIYIGILVLIRAILALPFNIYSTFVLEERFGFNKTTPVTFIADLIKSFLLALVLGGPLLAGILALVCAKTKDVDARPTRGTVAKTPARVR